jgi:PAS domain S-box-containing protein
MPEQGGSGVGTGGDAERTIRVLVVDDDPDVATMTAERLQRTAAADLSAAVEPGGRSGLERLEAERFDAVVSDYAMEDMDGLAFLEAVREEYPDLPFVLFTARGSEDLASRAISAGVTDYVRKGSADDQYDLLAQRVESAVSRQRTERELSELDRINRTIRRTIRRVVGGGNRAEIERVVCETLSESAPYLFAWFGTVTDDNRLVPAAWAGVERGYLDDVTVTTDRSPTGQGPSGRAARSGEPRATQNIREDPDFEPWREAAERRGYESSASIPVAFGDTRYGILNVYADRPHAFDERELEVLGELGTIVAHAIHRVTLTNRLEDQYETLFEESPVMAVTTRNGDDGPVVESCNRRLLDRLGYDREEVVGEPLASFYTADSETKLFDGGGYRRALTDDFAREKRTLVTADGEAVETLLRAVPRETETGETVGTFALYVDISERKRLERENERLDAFASIVSHDLRNPLTVIKGRAALASEQYDSEDVDAIVDAAARMEELIDDLLVLARQGKSVEETTPVRLSTITEDCWGNVDTGGATLEVATDATVLADESRLQQLFENLVRNSVEHGPDDGETGALTITVGVLPDGEGFYVEDDGVGIPEAERDRVFEAGYSTDDDSTGFGLSIVSEIAEAHGWTVETTEGETGGARFEFRGVDVVGERG